MLFPGGSEHRGVGGTYIEPGLALGEPPEQGVLNLCARAPVNTGVILYYGDRKGVPRLA